MVKEIPSIGVIGIQGAVSEHVDVMKQVFSLLQLDGKIRVIKPSDSIDDCDGLILPGGESTTISRILYSSGLLFDIKQRVMEKSLVIMGTCAGCILLANDLVDNTKNIELLQVMSMKVKRNAYGGQRESFEQFLDISSINSSLNNPNPLFPAVFIRAPIIEQVDEEQMNVLVYDSFQRPVMVKQDNCLALTFHPELSGDIRIHQYFLSIVEKFKKM